MIADINSLLLSKLVVFALMVAAANASSKGIEKSEDTSSSNATSPVFIKYDERIYSTIDNADFENVLERAQACSFARESEYEKQFPSPKFIDFLQEEATQPTALALIDSAEKCGFFWHAQAIRERMVLLCAASALSSNNPSSYSEFEKSEGTSCTNCRCTTSPAFISHEKGFCSKFDNAEFENVECVQACSSACESEHGKKHPSQMLRSQRNDATLR